MMENGNGLGSNSDPVASTYARGRQNGIPLNKQPLLEPRRIKVVCVGAGYSGLILAYKVKHQMKLDSFIDLKIYEKNDDVGGTWLENRYPGVACDVPAHVYTFCWEPNPDWSRFYASGPEIWEYIRRTTTKYKLDDFIEFKSRVVESIWDETTSRWKIKVDQGGKTIDTEADVLVNASGILNKWVWPEIEGLRHFKGTLLHSAAWDLTADWSGKRIGLIGNGSSAIQILPQVQPTASHVVNYIRSATWISLNFHQKYAPEGTNLIFTEEQKQRFHDHPEELTEYRKAIEHDFNKTFAVFIRDSEEQAAAYTTFSNTMAERLGHDEQLMGKLIPKWSVGCRRLTPGDGYLEALRKKNVSPCFDRIVKVTETGIETEKGHEDFDMIICATGFDVSFHPFWKLVGRDGRTLEKEWADHPEAYFGICAPGMPNYFIFNGPNSPVGHGSLLAAMDWTAEYILRWCEKIASQDISSTTVTDDAVADFNVYSQEFLRRSVWASGCRSWYNNGRTDGRVTAMYAGSVIHHKECLEMDRGEDFDIQYRSPNRFRFMGNGFTQREARDESLSFYLTK